MRSSTKFVIAFGIIFLLLFILEYNQEEPVDWTPGFGKTEKKPYGDFLLFEMLPEIFKGQVKTVNYSITEQINEEYYNHDNINYIFINDEINLNEWETEALLGFAARGNNVFMASTRFSDTLISSLGLKQGYLDEDNYHSFGDSLFHFNFCDNIKSIDTGYIIRNEYRQVNSFFDSIGDTKKMLAADFDHRCILTEVSHGKGKIILCTIPFALTNYYMLKPGTLDFIIKTLTRLPEGNVWWDEHYKRGGNKESSMRYILEKKGLRWAYYIGIAGLLLFVIFMGKRRQRIIPVLDPMKNASLEFAETVGQVYYEKGDHLNLAQKKIRYFSDYIRSKYNINVTQELKRNREEFYRNLSDKSGRSMEEINELFRYFIYIENTDAITEKELIYLNTLIEIFKTIHHTSIK